MIGIWGNIRESPKAKVVFNILVGNSIQANLFVNTLKI